MALVTLRVGVIDGMKPVLAAVPINVNVVEFKDNICVVVALVALDKPVADGTGPYEVIVQFIVASELKPPDLGAPVNERLDVVVQVVSVTLLEMVPVKVTAVPVGYIEGPGVKVEFNTMGVMTAVPVPRG